MEPDFALLKRVWCIAELVEANELHLNQATRISLAVRRCAVRRTCYALRLSSDPNSAAVRPS